MAGFIRRYTFDPGIDELAAIEGVAVIDREGPAFSSGVGTGTVTLVAEFENGPFNTPVEVFGGSDALKQFGGFGYVYDSVPANNPCARARYADGRLSPEFWNGNGAIALVRKAFRRLILCRVDTSVGAVEFTRRASVSGTRDPSWDLEPAQTLVMDIGAGDDTATFDADNATLQSADGTYPTTFAGGESMNVTIDEGTPMQIGPLDIFFYAGDQSHADVVARINAVLGYTAASTATLKTNLDGRVRGTSGNVTVNSVSGGSVTTATGFSAATDAGSGDVANIDAVTFAEAKALIEGDIAGVIVDRDANGAIRISVEDATGTPEITVKVASTAVAFGFDNVEHNATGTADPIPAGTRVTDGTDVWVTMLDVAVTATGTGPYSVKVRPANDDGTATAAAFDTVNELSAPALSGAYAVSNPLPLGDALSEPEIDALYADAMAKTINLSGVVRETNILIVARTSNAINSLKRQNAIDASAGGCRGRMAINRPPLGTLRTIARGDVPSGVGANRAERVGYAYPAVSLFVSDVAKRGIDGGAGFTADGFIDVGFDSWVASAMSQLNPEENPGQENAFLAAISGLEAANDDVQSLTIDDYRAFKAAGIMAPRTADGLTEIMSGVTSVDPLEHANQTAVNRRRLADFVEDSLALALKPFAKKLATRSRRGEAFSVVTDFLQGMKSDERITDFRVEAKSGNTVQTMRRGLFRMTVKVEQTPDMAVIVLDVQVGIGVVQITEVAA